jgi:hypothetical protein
MHDSTGIHERRFHRRRALAFAALLVVGSLAFYVLAGGTFVSVAQSAAQCQFDGRAPLVMPDPVCTPGVVSERPTKTTACDPDLHPRAYIPAAMRRAALARYGVDDDTFDGELDHQIPNFLFGDENLANLWPERGKIPNAKDKLETRVYNMICNDAPRSLGVKAAVRIFKRDWRDTYLLWCHDGTLEGTDANRPCLRVVSAVGA